MVYLVAVAIIVFLFLVIYAARKTKNKSQEELIRLSWGKQIQTTRDLNYIKNYSEVVYDPGIFQLSEQTLADIDIENIFPVVDRTTSKIGQQFLYYKLLHPFTQTESLPEFKTQLKFFSEQENTREKIQKTLLALNKPEAYFIASFLEKKNIGEEKNASLFEVLRILPLVILLLAIKIPGLLIFLIFVLAINLFLHFQHQNQFSDVIKSFSQLNILLVTAEKIADSELPYEMESIKDKLKLFRRFRRNSNLMNFRSMSDDLSSLFLLPLLLIKVLFLIDVRFFYTCREELNANTRSLKEIFNFVGTVDFTISVCSLKADEQHATCSPEFLTADKKLSAVALYHPLIENCVANSININGKSIFITGSNMSGKSTFLRSVLINSILAQTLYTCFAEAYITPVLQQFSSIKISDDLQQAKSFYYKEVNVIYKMIEQSRNKTQNIFIIDEIFKGTNTIERISLAKATLEYLNAGNNIVIASSHDLELLDLLNDKFERYYFGETVNENKLNFSHKIKEGAFASKNAIKIVEIEGYPAELVENAYCTSKIFKSLEN